jgi:DNA-binding NarL/FixJ family response regulator
MDRGEACKMNDTTNASPWRVVLIEDHLATLRFFEQCIAQHPDLTLAASFSTLRPALEWFNHHTADILLTDLQLPDGSGLDALRAVGARHPACDKLVISMFGDELHVVASIEAGAVGYLLKDTNANNIAQVLLDVKRGASPISPMVARGVLSRLLQLQSASAQTAIKTPADAQAQTHEADLPDRLSAREREVLKLLARGYSYAEIAKLCGISLHTVQGHIKKIYGKLAVCSRGEAVFEADRMGLLNQL